MKVVAWLKKNSQSILMFVVVLLVWHFGVILFGVKEFILPSPLAAVKSIFQAKYRWPMNFMATFYEVVGGFLVSGLVGVILVILVFTFVGLFMRGPYWHFYWPWQAWPEIPVRI